MEHDLTQPDPTQPDLTIETQSGAVGLTLTRTHVMMHATDALKQELRKETADDPDVKTPGFAGRFARFVTGSVQKLLEQKISYSLEDIEAVIYDGETLVFSYRRKHRLSFEDVREENRPALSNFSEGDARAFVAAFDQQKQS